MLREVRDPLRVAVGSDDGAIVAGAVARAAAAMDVFSEIVTEQRPVACELGELIQLARGATQGLSAGVGSNVTVTGNAAMKIEALPGRLAQLLVHLLEICIGRAPGGAVIVSLRDEIGGVTVEMSPVPGDAIDLQGGADGDEIHLLRLAACEALLRELGGSLELSDSAVGGGCCLRLGRSE